MHLFEVLTEDVSTQEVYEANVSLNPRDFSYARAGIIIKGNKAIGLKAPLLKAVKKEGLKETDLKISSGYEVKTYYTNEASGGHIKDQVSYFNEDDRNLAIIDVKPYRKISKGVAVTFIIPKGKDEKFLNGLVRSTEYIATVQKKPYVTFFNDEADANTTVDVESFQEFKLMDSRLKNVTTPELKSKESYKFVVDPDTVNTYKTKTKVQKEYQESPYLMITGTGYVRLGGTSVNSWGDDRTQNIHTPTGNTDLERKQSAWAAALAFAKKKKWM